MAEPLLPKIAAGDAGAVRECIARYNGLVWSMAVRFCRNKADAEDATQEIFLAIWKSAARFDSDMASEPAFVAMIARRRLIDTYRKQQSQADVGELTTDVYSADPSPDDVASNAEEAQCAVEVLNELQPEEQKVIRLAVYNTMTHAEISEATGLPLGTVKTKVRRGLQRLRERLQGLSLAEGGAQ